jgi:hypothetical protein
MQYYVGCDDLANGIEQVSAKEKVMLLAKLNDN